MGQSTTFTATASGGSGTYTSYQWYENGLLAQSGTASVMPFTPASTGSYLIAVAVTDSLGVTSALSSAATVTVNQLAITVTQTTNGVISPGTSTVNYGATPSFTITPNTGYYIASITANGASVTVTSPSGQTYQFNPVSANGSLTATFAINTYSLTVNVDPNGSSNIASQTVNWGSVENFVFTPDTGYSVADVMVNGTIDEGAVASLGLTVTGDTTVDVSFAINTYMITVTQTANGVITPGTSTVNYGATPSFTITPNTGYYIASITANGASVTVTSPSGQTYQFSAVSADGSLTATFTAIITTAVVSSPSPIPIVSSPTPTPKDSSPSPTPVVTSPSPTPKGSSPSPTPKGSLPSPTPLYVVLFAVIAIAAIILITVGIAIKRSKRKLDKTLSNPETSI